MQRLGFGLPMIECSRDADGDGGRVRELKANGHQLLSREVIEFMIVFHDGELSNLRDADVATVIDDAEDIQQPQDDADYHDDVEDFFDLPVHRDVGVDEPKQHANDDQSDNE